LAAATPAATPGEACQCIMIAANKGMDALLTVDTIMCGPMRLKAVHPQGENLHHGSFLLFTQAAGVV
jgi:hypothetical protein